MVPDVLDVAAARDAQVDRSIAARHESVLRLAVQAQRWRGDAQPSARCSPASSCAECAASRDSAYRARAGSLMSATLMRVASPRHRAPAPMSPPPRSATKMLPVRPSARPRLGQPSTPRTTSPSSTRASAMAYWPPRRKPLVPSTGSSVHQRPVAPPCPAAAVERGLRGRLVEIGQLPGELPVERGTDGIGRVTPDLARVLLAHDRIGREGVAEREADEHLGTEVRHRHRGAVRLLGRVRGREGRPDRPTQPCWPTGRPRRRRRRSRVTRRERLPPAPRPQRRPRRGDARVTGPLEASRSAARWVPAGRSTARRPRRSGG